MSYLLFPLILLVLMTTLNAQSWEKQISTPTSSQMSAVYFLDANTGFIAGSGGEIHKTTDGGSSWTKTVTNSSDTHNSIFFANSNVGYICSYNGKIYKTADGGGTWTAQNSGKTSALKCIQFVDANTGWAVGDGGVILKTVNGGTNWTAQTSNTTVDLEGVHFIDANTGYATGVSGYVCKTVNGGANWAANMISDATYRHSIFFVDANTGWVVGRGNKISKTVNGGVDWTAQASPVANQQWRMVKFISSTTGFAVSEGGKIIKTVDGGTTWVEQNSGISSSLYSCFFIDANLGFAVGSYGKILKTTNAGTNWVQVNKGTGQTLYDIRFFDANNGITIGGGGDVFKTSNSGTDWIQKTSGTDKDLISFHFFDSNNGIAVGYAGNILKTTDGGNSWSKTVYPNAGYDFTSVHFPTASVGYIVGSNNNDNYGAGIIIKTVDGGTTWSVADSAIADLMFPLSVFFTDAGTGYIAGYDWWTTGNGYLYKTTDGGASQVLINTNPGHANNSVYFINATTGFLTGDPGIIMKTTDSGTIWEKKTGAEVTDNIYQIKFINSNTGIALGSSSLLSTYDAGETWTDVPVAPYNSLMSAAVYNNSVWICGSNGLVIKNVEVLPVELTSFTASTAGNGVILKWETATEVDNYGFEIERASLGTTPCQDRLKWEKIGFVDGAGNSNSSKQYSFVDADPANGNVQYRLKQINTNGSFVYYKQIAEVNYSLTGVNEKQIPTEFALDQNYPNPFNPTTRIKYAVGKVSVGNNSQSSEQLVTLKVYDILGNEVATLVNEHKAPGYYEVEFSAGNLSTGVYIYRITAGEFTTTKKLMLMK